MKRCVLEANGFAASYLHLYVVGWARPGPAGRKTHFDVIDDLVTGAMRDRLRVRRRSIPVCHTCGIIAPERSRRRRLAIGTQDCCWPGLCAIAPFERDGLARTHQRRSRRCQTSVRAPQVDGLCAARERWCTSNARARRSRSARCRARSPRPRHGPGVLRSRRWSPERLSHFERHSQTQFQSTCFRSSRFIEPFWLVKATR
jgi:hypothetical protein